MRYSVEVSVACAGVLAFSSISGSQDVPFHELGIEGARVVAPAPGAEGFGVYLRPLDDSDPEMKSLMETFFELTPCGRRVNGLCPEALGLLTGGGDRLANYLIVQVEANEQEGFPNPATYLRLVGYTESQAAVDYLLQRVDSLAAVFEAFGGDHTQLMYAIEALGRTRAELVAEKAVELLERLERPSLRIRAIHAFDRVQSKQGPRPELLPRILAVREQLVAKHEARVAAAVSAGNPVPIDLDLPLDARIRKVLAEPGQTRP